MDIKALSYVGLGDPDARAWLAYGRDVLGMQTCIDGEGRARLRMDDRHQRIMIEPAAQPGLAWTGWEVADETALSQARTEVAAWGVAVRDGTLEECGARGLSGLIVFADPADNRVELAWGPTVSEPFTPGRPGLGGFDTSSGLAHLALIVPDLAAGVAFYEGLLGFEESDRISGPFEARFLRTNDRHHSLVLFEGKRSAIDHLMVEVSDIHDLGTALDAARAGGIAPSVTLGYHPGEGTLSCYLPSPGGFRVEYGITLAGRQSPPWGHDGLMASIGAETPTAALAEASR